jgi:hypothetical protein
MTRIDGQGDEGGVDGTAGIDLTAASVCLRCSFVDRLHSIPSTRLNRSNSSSAMSVSTTHNEYSTSVSIREDVVVESVEAECTD